MGSFWWRVILKLLSLCKRFAICTTSMGDIIFFWSDPWDNIDCKTSIQRFFSFTCNKEITLKHALELDNADKMFHRPLSVVAHQQYMMLHCTLTNTPVLTHADRWYYTQKCSKYLKEICPRGNNKVVILYFLIHDKCLLFMLELY